MRKLHYIFLLLICIIGCASYSDDEDEIRGIFPSDSVTETESQTPAEVVPIPLPVVEEVEAVEVEEEPEPEPEPEPEEEEEEPVDDTAPKMINSTVQHGDTGVDTDTDRFVFTFDEEIDIAHIKLWNNTRKLDMKWKTFIDGKRVVLLRLPPEGLRMKMSELYTIELRWRDAARNWEPKDWGVIRIISFQTEIKE